MGRTGGDTTSTAAATATPTPTTNTTTTTNNNTDTSAAMQRELSVEAGLSLLARATALLVPELPVGARKFSTVGSAPSPIPRPRGDSLVSPDMEEVRGLWKSQRVLTRE